MNETQYAFLVIPAKILAVALFVWLYALGGRAGIGKWVRRFLGGALLGLAIIALSLWIGTFKWWLVALPACYIAALCMGYGVNEKNGVSQRNIFLKKVFRRGLYGLAFGGCAFLVASATGRWSLAIFQSTIAISASLFMGITNPVKAVDEEALIATLSVACIPFMV